MIMMMIVIIMNLIIQMLTKFEMHSILQCFESKFFNTYAPFSCL